MGSNSTVWVDNACKSYGNKEVLKGLCMEVQSGHIYGLLGASGCGKTTLLNCILGSKKLNSGQVWVLGGKPGEKGSGIPGPRVGYMPQDVALVGELTVKDAIFFFGRILNMSDKVIEARFYELSTLLDLPPEDRMVKDCSGGQQRRLSFAVAMVHKPELLILDEPTVGVDPVLRERMWDYLVELTKKEKTAVIITTHYIEEARRSNVIGLMRDGKLLAQESPTRLLSLFNTDSLEEVFLILSRRQEQGQLDNLSTSPEADHRLQNSSSNISTISLDTSRAGSTDALTPTRNPTRKKVQDFGVFNNKRFVALVDKNLKHFYRNISGAVFLLCFPILNILSFLLAIGGDPRNINLAIVNHEGMSASCPNFTFNGTAVPGEDFTCGFRDMSCRFLTYLENPMISKVKYDSLDGAFDAVKHGDAVGVIYMAQNFTQNFERRFLDGREAKSDVLDHSQIKVWLDLSNRQIGATIKYKLYQLYQNFANDFIRDCKFEPKLVEFFDLETIYGEIDDIFTIFMIPGIVLTVLFFIGTIMTSHIIVTERIEGIWERTSIAGVTSLEITLSHLVLQGVISIFHTLVVLVLPFAIFNFDYVGSIWTLSLLCYLQGVAGLAFGFWISIISYNYTMVNIITNGVFYFMILICGLMWPIQGMPVALQWVSKCLPFTIAIQSFRNVMVKGWTIDNLEVLNGIGIEIVWILTLALVNIYLIKAKQN